MVLVQHSLVRIVMKLLTLITTPIRYFWRFFKALSKKKQLFFIVILVLIIFVIANRLKKASSGPSYELETATLGSITELVSETGNITSSGAIPVYSTSTGLVESVSVKNGDIVNKNTNLFKVVSSATKQEKNTALANYMAAKTAYQSVQATQYSLQATMFSQWDSFKDLAESDDYEDANGNPKTDQRNLPEFMVPEKQWLAAEANFKKETDALRQASAAQSAAWQAYQATQDSQVTAVIGGEIRNLSLSPGDVVAAPTSLTISSTPPALVIYDPSASTIVKVDIGETDAIKVQAGQPVTIQLDALPNRTFMGHVDRVDSFTNPTGGVVDYSVYIVLDDPDPSIKGGMTADVDITVASKDNVLTVPTSAVKPYEGGRAVRVVGDKGDVKYIPVETGSKGDGKIEITSGISQGQQIITALTNDQVKRTSSGGLFQ